MWTSLCPGSHLERYFLSNCPICSNNYPLAFHKPCCLSHFRRGYVGCFRITVIQTNYTLIQICLNLIFEKGTAQIMSPTEASEITHCREQGEEMSFSEHRAAWIGRLVNRQAYYVSMKVCKSHAHTHTCWQLTCKCEFSLSIKASLPSLLMLWAISAMALLLEWNIKRAGKAAIKLIFNRSQLITFLCVSLCTGWGWGHNRRLLARFNATAVTPDVL